MSGVCVGEGGQLCRRETGGGPEPGRSPPAYSPAPRHSVPAAPQAEQQRSRGGAGSRTCDTSKPRDSTSVEMRILVVPSLRQVYVGCVGWGACVRVCEGGGGERMAVQVMGPGAASAAHSTPGAPHPTHSPTHLNSRTTLSRAVFSIPPSMEVQRWPSPSSCARVGGRGRWGRVGRRGRGTWRSRSSSSTRRAVVPSPQPPGSLPQLPSRPPPHTHGPGSHLGVQQPPCLPPLTLACSTRAISRERTKMMV